MGRGCADDRRPLFLGTALRIEPDCVPVATLVDGTELLLLPLAEDRLLALTLAPEADRPCGSILVPGATFCAACAGADDCAHARLLSALSGPAADELWALVREAYHGARWVRPGDANAFSSMVHVLSPEGAPFFAAVRMRSGGAGYSMRTLRGDVRGEVRVLGCDRCASRACALIGVATSLIADLTGTIDSDTPPSKGTLIRDDEVRVYLHAMPEGSDQQTQLTTGWRISFGEKGIPFQIRIGDLAVVAFSLSPDLRTDCPVCRRRPCPHDQILQKRKTQRAA